MKRTEMDQLIEAHIKAESAGDTAGAVAVYTEELFATGNDVDNRAAVAAVPAEKLALVGLAVYGPRRGRAANRHLARGPELNTGPQHTGPQPVVPGSPFGSTPAETFVRVGPRARIRFPPAIESVRIWCRCTRRASTGR